MPDANSPQIHPTSSSSSLAANALAPYRAELTTAVGGHRDRPVFVVLGGSVMTLAEHREYIGDRRAIR